ncbi:hypothetical protein [Actinophytocola xanthii]|uniref:Uncharacterized protein n=1 Tax=Actinophytocola xanthii TaxID=1912961 RepID=A0A1Q8CPU8_9PSEU|nr:hypothetical protein [Actinophytocola xanthii]OLF16358.1 hypothetical protein BU204_17420 [Actinophytocola xanthii]
MSETVGTSPEKSTNQLEVWRQLLEVLQRLDDVWGNTQTAGSHSALSAQLPANLASALAKAAGRGVGTIAGITQVLAHQLDSGDAFRSSALALSNVVDGWPGGH